MSEGLDQFINTMLNRRMTTQEWVTDAIRQAIINGFFGENEPIDTAELAQKLGVSRMPIRIALHQLESEGLVLLESHKRPIALKLSSAEVLQIGVIRRELEALAIRLAVENITDAQVDQLEEITMDIDACTEPSEFLALNSEFHTLINQVSGNDTLTGLIHQLRNKVERYLRIYVADPTNRKNANDEHKVIVKALRKRDVSLCDRAIREHVTHTFNDVANLLLEKEREGARNIE